MRSKALAIRILSQLRHDRRTLALMLMAPILMLTLIYIIFAGISSSVTVGVINAPAGFIDNLEANNVTVIRYTQPEALRALEAGKVVATINIIGGKSYIEVDGSNPGNARTALNAMQAAKMNSVNIRPDMISEIKYVYGYEESDLFDNYGAVLIGFMIFFFVFLVAGISFLQERTSGTLEKLLSTPIKRWEIVVGYILGFGLVTVMQSFLISWYCVYVLDVVMIGSFALVLLITLLSAMVALTMGILASTAANSEFQMMQMIPVVIIPQLFFSGLFNLPDWLAVIEKTVPLYYIADALTQVMIKGNGISTIIVDLSVLLGFSVLFITANTRLLKKYRRI